MLLLTDLTKPDGNALSAQMLHQSQFVPVFPEPLLIDPVVRHDAFHHVPEVLRMVHMGQMAELMHHHIVQGPGGTVDQTVVKGQRASRRAASPAGFLVSYGDGGIVAAGESVVVFYPVGKHLSGGIPVSVFQSLQSADLRSGQRLIVII